MSHFEYDIDKVIFILGEIIVDDDQLSMICSNDSENYEINEDELIDPYELSMDETFDMGYFSNETTVYM